MINKTANLWLKMKQGFPFLATSWKAWMASAVATSIFYILFSTLCYLIMRGLEISDLTSFWTILLILLRLMYLILAFGASFWFAGKIAKERGLNTSGMAFAGLVVVLVLAHMMIVSLSVWAIALSIRNLGFRI